MLQSNIQAAGFSVAGNKLASHFLVAHVRERCAINVLWSGQTPAAHDLDKSTHCRNLSDISGPIADNFQRQRALLAPCFFDSNFCAGLTQKCAWKNAPRYYGLPLGL
ncbi:MAG: hypothetical protein ACI90G_001438 [Urechidicola sp.]